MTAFLALSVLLTARVSVDVRLEDATEIRGQLDTITPHEVRILSAEGNLVALDRALVATISLTRRPDAASEPSPAGPVAVMLRDGMLLRVNDVRAQQQGQQIVFMADTPIALPRHAVYWIRFAGSSQRDQQWEGILRRRATGDLLVVRRPGGHIDYLEGVLGDMDEQRVEFQFDGRNVSLRRDRVEGLIYFAPSAPTPPRPRGRVVMASGNALNFEDIATEGEELKLKIFTGTSIRLPLASLQRIDMSVTRQAYLSDLEPESVEWTPLVGTPQIAEQLKVLYQVRRDATLQGEPLRLQVAPSPQLPTTFAKGLAIHSRTQLLYRLSGRFRRLDALAGLSELAGPEGVVRLVISADDTTRFDQLIHGAQPAVPVALDITGAMRLKIVVDFGDQSDLGDHLYLCDARLTE